MAERFDFTSGTIYGAEALADMTDEELATEISCSEMWEPELIRELAWRADLIDEYEQSDEDDVEEIAEKAAEALGVSIEDAEDLDYWEFSEEDITVESCNGGSYLEVRRMSDGMLYGSIQCSGREDFAALRRGESPISSEWEDGCGNNCSKAGWGVDSEVPLKNPRLDAAKLRDEGWSAEKIRDAKEWCEASQTRRNWTSMRKARTGTQGKRRH